MQESKIDLTDRLRREGRWESASLERDKERQRLRDEGLGRKESNAKSWEWMAKEHPPMSEYEIDWHDVHRWFALAEIDFGWASHDAVGEVSLSDLWPAYCCLRAFLCRYDKKDMPGASSVLGQVLFNPMNESARVILIQALINPDKFFDVLETKIQSACERCPAKIESTLDRDGLKEFLQQVKSARQEFAKLPKTLSNLTLLLGLDVVQDQEV